MRNAILYTKTPLEMDECFKEIKKIYEGAKKFNNEIVIGKSSKSLYIWLPSTDSNDPIDKEDIADDLEHIPFDNPYFTHIDFHLLSTLQCVIKSLYSLYPEMIIWVDDDEYYAALDFVNAVHND